jgi:hypothetical protein
MNREADTIVLGPNNFDPEYSVEEIYYSHHLIAEAKSQPPLLEMKF